VSPQETKRSPFQSIQRECFTHRVLEAGWFKHLILDRATRTNEANAAVWLLASQLFRDGDAGGEMPAGAASSKDVQRRLRVSVIAQ
jgi:hypothetical protein